MASEIKPCPFCGTSMVVVTKDMFAHPGTLGDHRCLLAGKGYHWGHIDWWNTRAGEAEAAYIEVVAKLDKAVEALEWYQEKAEGCRKITRDGDNARHALDADYGRRAKAVITLIAAKPERDE